MLVLLLGGTLLGPSVIDAIDVPLDSTGASSCSRSACRSSSSTAGSSSRRSPQPRGGRARPARGPGCRGHGARHGHGRLHRLRHPVLDGPLIGAVVAPTDPAILIPLFDRIGIRQKIEQTAIAESALNDATGAVLALVLAGVVASGDASVADPALDFLEDLGSRPCSGSPSGSSSRWSSRTGGRGLEGVGGDRGRRGRRGRLLLDRLGGRQRLPGAFLAGLIVGNMDRLRLGMHTEHERDMRVARRHDHRGRRDPRLHHARREPAVERHLGQPRRWLSWSSRLILLGRPLTVSRLPRRRSSGSLDAQGDGVPLLDARDRGGRGGAGRADGRPRHPRRRAHRDDRRRCDRSSRSRCRRRRRPGSAGGSGSTSGPRAEGRVPAYAAACQCRVSSAATGFDSSAKRMRAHRRASSRREGERSPSMRSRAVIATPRTATCPERSCRITAHASGVASRRQTTPGSPLTVAAAAGTFSTRRREPAEAPARVAPAPFASRDGAVRARRSAA